MQTHHLPPKAMDALKEQLQAFEKKFGRAAGPDDPVFFDPDFDVPVQIAKQKLEDQMIVTMADAGTRPELIWVYLKVGLLPTTENKHLMSAKDKRDVDRAWEEYERDKPDLSTRISAAKERLAANAYYEKA